MRFAGHSFLTVAPGPRVQASGMWSVHGGLRHSGSKSPAFSGVHSTL
jgi:hypothetical protein